MEEKTLGETRVRIDFNPSNNDVVSQIKQKTAELINLCESIKDPYDGKPNEKNRALAVAQTEYESAAMWAVKGATALKV
jgi:hypothetical protein